MKFTTIMMLLMAGAAMFAGAQEGKVTLNIVKPKPQFTGTPKDIRSPNLEPARNGKPRPPLKSRRVAIRLFPRTVR